MDGSTGEPGMRWGESNWRPPALDQVGVGEQRSWCSSVATEPEKIIKVPGSATHTLKSVSDSPSHMTQVLFKLLSLGLGAREFLHVPFKF